MVAAEANAVAALRVLLHSGAAATGSALHRAACCGHAAAIELLLAHQAPLEYRTAAGFNSLHGACSGGHYEAARALIDASASVDEWAPNPDPKLPVGQRELGFNPVILAALNDHTSVLQLLGDNGVCVDAADNAKKTALMHAAGNGYVGAMRVLMAMGSRVDHQDGDGETALYRAVLNGYEPAVRILLQV